MHCRTASGGHCFFSPCLLENRKNLPPAAGLSSFFSFFGIRFRLALTRSLTVPPKYGDREKKKRRVIFPFFTFFLNPCTLYVDIDNKIGLSPAWPLPHHFQIFFVKIVGRKFRLRKRGLNNLLTWAEERGGRLYIYLCPVLKIILYTFCWKKVFCLCLVHLLIITLERREFVPGIERNTRPITQILS